MGGVPSFRSPFSVKFTCRRSILSLNTSHKFFASLLTWLMNILDDFKRFLVLSSSKPPILQY